MEMLRHLFSSADDAARLLFVVGPRPFVLHVASDAAIGLSYYMIPIALAYFESKRHDVAFGWSFWAFAAFILACGTTHSSNRRMATIAILGLTHCKPKADDGRLARKSER